MQIIIKRRNIHYKSFQQHTDKIFFGFFNFSGRATSWLGAIIFGGVILRTGSARLAILSLVVLFVIGLLITLPVNVAQGQREAEE